MDDHTRECNSPNEPDCDQLWHILTTFADIVDVLECAREGQTDLRTRVECIVNLIASPGIITTASRNTAISSILRYLRTMSPSSPIAGPSAVHAAGPASNDQATATSSIARAPAIRGRGRAPTGDGPETAPSHRQVSFNQWVKVIKISTGGVPSSRMKALDPLCLPAAPRPLAGPSVGPSSARVAAVSAATPVVTAHIKANSVSRRRTVASLPLRLIADQPIGRHLAAQARVHRAPCDDTPESSQAAKRRRVDRHVSDCGTTADPSGTFYDVSGEQVTSERLLVVFGASPYISLGY
ncbi:hypothetical protein GGI13_007854, partial [Coemansia sp. RSA 455]